MNKLINIDLYVKIMLTLIAVCLVWICLNAVALVPSVQAASNTHRIIEAERFVLVDKDGKRRGDWGVYHSHVVLTLDAENGKPSLRLSSAGGLEVIGEDGNSRAALGFMNGQPAFTIRDKRGVPRVGIHMGPDGSPHLGLSDSNGKSLAALSVSGAGSPELLLFGTNWELGRLPARTQLGVSQRGDPYVKLYDNEEKVVWSAP